MCDIDIDLREFPCYEKYEQSCLLFEHFILCGLEGF